MSKSWEQILGGYATNTLTEEEKRQLFEAALQDQALFEALADEEALKALLANPDARQRILGSLQASPDSQWIVQSSSSWFSWFRQPSSLAWAGGLAAMGLALIFGWQMDKDWGPMVQQEQQKESAVRENFEDHDAEVALRSETSKLVEMKEKDQDAQKNDQREPAQVATLSAPAPTIEPPAMANASKEVARMRQAPAQVPAKPALRQEVKKERRLKAKEPVASTPESALVQQDPADEPVVAPSMSSPETTRKGSQQLFRSPAFVDQVQKGDASSSQSARELFYANKSTRVDEVGEERDGRRAQQLLGGRSSKTEKALTEEVSDLKKSQEVVQDDSQGQARGIRYRIVRGAADGNDEAIDITQFSGKWSELYLAIESNVSGHLYVLTEYGKGKWQFVRPEALNVPRSSDGAIQVKAYQPVNFALSQVTNRLGKPVVSSIAVLLSSQPLTDLGKWLGRAGGSEQLENRLTEHTGGEVFTLDLDSSSSNPFLLELSLLE